MNITNQLSNDTLNKYIDIIKNKISIINYDNYNKKGYSKNKLLNNTNIDIIKNAIILFNLLKKVLFIDITNILNKSFLIDISSYFDLIQHHITVITPSKNNIKHINRLIKIANKHEKYIIINLINTDLTLFDFVKDLNRMTIIYNNIIEIYYQNQKQLFMIDLKMATYLSNFFIKINSRNEFINLICHENDNNYLDLQQYKNNITINVNHVNTILENIDCESLYIDDKCINYKLQLNNCKANTLYLNIDLYSHSYFATFKNLFGNINKLIIMSKSMVDVASISKYCNTICSFELYYENYTNYNKYVLEIYNQLHNCSSLVINNNNNRISLIVDELIYAPNNFKYVELHYAVMNINQLYLIIDNYYNKMQIIKINLNLNKRDIILFESLIDKYGYDFLNMFIIKICSNVLYYKKNLYIYSQSLSMLSNEYCC